MLAMASPIPVAPTIQDNPATTTGTPGISTTTEPDDPCRDQHRATPDQLRPGDLRDPADPDTRSRRPTPGRHRPATGPPLSSTARAAVPASAAGRPPRRRTRRPGLRASPPRTADRAGRPGCRPAAAWARSEPTCTTAAAASADCCTVGPHPGELKQPHPHGRGQREPLPPVPHGRAGRRRVRRTRITDGSAITTGTTASGAMPRNTSRQLSWSARKPATSGPTIDGTTQAADSAANIRGRRSSSYARPTST